MSRDAEFHAPPCIHSHPCHHWPSRLFCICMVTLQASALDYHLTKTKSITWSAVSLADVIVLICFVISFALATKRVDEDDDEEREEYLDLILLNLNSKIYRRPMSSICWAMYGTLTTFKLAVICDDVKHLNDEIPYLGPTLLKFAFGVTSIVFILFMETQQVVQSDTAARVYIANLVGSAPFDILDGVEAVSTIFSASKRHVPESIQTSITAACCLDLLLPTFHLAAVSASMYGLKPLPKKYVLLYKVVTKLAVNVPLLTLRSILWAKFGQDASIFVVKNISAIGLLVSEVYQTVEFWDICTIGDSKNAKDPVYTRSFDSVFGSSIEESGVHERRKRFRERRTSSGRARVYQGSMFQ